jgi:hypothetical protein
MKDSLQCKASLAPENENLSVRTFVDVTKKRAKIRKSYHLLGLAPNVNFNVYRTDLTSIVRTIKERVFYVSDGKEGFVTPPIPEERHVQAYCAKFTDAFNKRVHTVSPLTNAQFVGAYVGRRRTVYEKALESLHGNPLVKKDSILKYFLKVEKTNFTAKSNPVPRGISPRDPRYHVSLGPFIKRIEHKVYNIVADIFGATTIAKGLNAQKRGNLLKEHWDTFTDPVAVGLDASRFDQHVSKEMLEIEHSLYMMFFPGNKKLAKLLRWQIKNVGKARVPGAAVSFAVTGTRASGDMNTALGNCLIMCMNIYSFMMSVGMSPSQYRLINDGDDCVLIMERKNLSKLTTLPQDFLKLGFNMKVEDPVFVFEEIVFCQAQPVLTPEGAILVRQPKISLAKDCMSIKPLDSIGIFRKWTSAVGKGGISLTGQIPILQDFYESFIRSSEGSKPLRNDPSQETGLEKLSKGMKRSYGQVPTITRVSFWRAFGIEPAKQEAIEAEFRRITIVYDPKFPVSTHFRCF